MVLKTVGWIHIDGLQDALGLLGLYRVGHLRVVYKRVGQIKLFDIIPPDPSIINETHFKELIFLLEQRVLINAFDI